MSPARDTRSRRRPHSLSVVSWYAPTVAPLSRYPWVARPATLAWPKREAAIVAMLGRLDADVVCLQEVEVALWDGPLRRTHQPGVERRPAGDAGSGALATWSWSTWSRRSTRSFSHTPVPCRVKERKKTDKPNEGWEEDRVVPTCTSRILEGRSGTPGNGSGERIATRRGARQGSLCNASKFFFARQAVCSRCGKACPPLGLD